MSTEAGATSATPGSAVKLWGIDPSGYEQHRLHAPGRTYLETNCYADVLIELLHARGDEPLAMLSFIVRTDWEGDQFTYFKPPYHDLYELFGIEIHEMLPYRTVPEHIEEQLRLQRTVLVEIDAWYLPDTAATSYRREHLKTTVAPEMIDREGERMRYFHNAGVFDLEGEDYRGAFRMLPQFTADVMDPFIEVVRFDAGEGLRGEALRSRARQLLASHFALRPARNPFLSLGRVAERGSAAAASRRRRRLSRVRVRHRADGRRRVRAARGPRRVGPWRRRRSGRRRSAADRRRLEGDLLQARAPSAVRSRSCDPDAR